MIKILLLAVLIYVGLIYLAVWAHLLIGKITGELNLTWYGYLISAVFAPLFLAVVIPMNPTKLWNGIKEEIRMRKEKPTA